MSVCAFFISLNLLFFWNYVDMICICFLNLTVSRALLNCVSPFNIWEVIISSLSSLQPLLSSISVPFLQGFVSFIALTAGGRGANGKRETVTWIDATPRIQASLCINCMEYYTCWCLAVSNFIHIILVCVVTRNSFIDTPFREDYVQGA